MAEVWAQEADFEEGDLTDFDVVSPTWDAEVDVKADFDAVTDAAHKLKMKN